MNQNNKPFFYLISSILPAADKTGGQIVLHRHLLERSDFEFEILDVPQKTYSFFKLLERSFLRTYIKAFEQYYTWSDTSVLRAFPPPDFILTVAHGRKCFAAMAAAKYWNVPLITIFHDWYPASSDVHPALRWISEISFRSLYKQSALAFCVSKQMIKALGHHTDAIHLPPIPSSGAMSGAIKPHAVPRFFYSGFCGGAYGDMLNRFILQCRHEQVIARFSGSGTEGLVAGGENITILGFLPEDDFVQIFDDSDILLIFLNFAPEKQKHFSTHFPSKLVEYCGKGKLICIWGPGYSTAVAWAKETGAAFYFSDNDAGAFLKALLKVFESDERRNSYIKQAEAIYKSEFAPERIHFIFKNEILKIVDHAKN